MEITRSYTPITLDSDLGYFELVIKVTSIILIRHFSISGFVVTILVFLYEQMYPNGRMSHHFREMCLGDYLPVRGPVVCDRHCAFLYIDLDRYLSSWSMMLLLLKGRFRYSRGHARAFGMLAGGSGITPMFQVYQKTIDYDFMPLPSQLRSFIYLFIEFGFFHRQLIRAILENPKDRTNIYLIYANMTFEDILLKV